MISSRREIITLAGLGLASASLPTRLEASTTPPPGIDTLRQALLLNRNRILSLHLVYTTDGDEAGPPRQLYFDGRNYHLRQETSGKTAFQIVTPRDTVTGLIGNPSSYHRRPTAKWPPATSLENFLPSITRLPSLPEGTTTEDAFECVRLSQGSYRLLVGLAPTVVRSRTAIVAATGLARLTDTFADFRVIAPDVLFPFRIDHHVFDRAGVVAAVRSTRVHSAEANQPLDPTLFDVAQYRR